MLGPAAAVTLDTHILRSIAYSAAAANWQRANGKGKRPEPFRLPGEKTQPGEKSKAERGADIAARLENLGLLPATAGKAPSPEELRRRGEDLFLGSEQRLATES